MKRRRFQRKQISTRQRKDFEDSDFEKCTIAVLVTLQKRDIWLPMDNGFLYSLYLEMKLCFSLSLSKQGVKISNALQRRSMWWPTLRSLWASNRVERSPRSFRKAAKSLGNPLNSASANQAKISAFPQNLERDRESMFQRPRQASYLWRRV